MHIASPVPLRRALPLGRPPRRLVLAAVLLLALGGAAALAYARLLAPAPPAPAGQVVSAQRAPIAATVNATGSVVATRQAKLVFAATGRVQDVLVNVGDAVKTGQPLARLVSDSLQVKLDTARSQLAQAQIKLAQVSEGATAEDVAAARGAYDAAVAKYQDLAAGATPADLAAARAAVVQARANAAEAQAKLQALQNVTDADRAAAEAALTQAQNTLDSSQAKLDDLQAGATPQDLATARASLDQATSQLGTAQAKLDAARSGTQADLAAAQAALDQAQATATTTRAKLDQLKATTAVPSDVAAAQSSLAAAAAKMQTAYQTLDQLSAQLAAAQANLAAQQSSLGAAEHAAQRACDKFGGSSSECADASSKVDSLQPQLLQSQQQIKLLQGDGSWNHLAAQRDLEAAQAAYAAASTSLKQVEAAHQVPADLIAAQSNADAAASALVSARAKLAQAKVQAQLDLATAQAAVDQARDGVATAQAKLETVQQGATNADRVAAQNAVDTARANLAAAQAKLGGLGSPTPTDQQSAEAALTSAQAAALSAQAKLDQVTRGPQPGELESARSAIAAAQATLVSKSGDNARASDLAAAQEAVRQAELAVRQATLDLDATTLLAPFDGVVAAVNGNPGENAPSGTTGFLTLVDPSQVRVDVTVDETDVARIGLGKPAEMTFDALPGRRFRGKVLAIAPTGTLNQGVVTYPVSISIDARGQVLPAGMTATALITIDQRDDAVVVPVRAVRRQGRDQSVEVLGPDDRPQARPVRTGVQNDQMVEITDGLAEGERVLIAGTTTRAPNVGGAPGAVPARR